MENTCTLKTRIHVQDNRSAISSLADNKSITDLLEAQKHLDIALSLYSNVLEKEVGTSAEVDLQEEVFGGRLADCSMDISELFGRIAYDDLCNTLVVKEEA